MAQKIKLRRGPVGNLPSVATQQGELLLATGSISNLTGPFLTMTGTGGTGTSTLVGKIYEGSTAPSIAANSVLTGTPFYATSNNTLYRLNHAGNEALDLSGNLENTNISNIQISTLSGSVEVLGDITGSNLLLTGNANIDGNIVLGGNITLGDQDVDFVSFKADVSSSIIPDNDNAFDLGSPSKNWRNLHVSGTAYIDTLEAENLSFTDVNITNNLSVSGSAEVSGGLQLLTTLDVDGQTTLASVNVENLTNNRVVIVGASGQLEDDLNFTFDGTTLTVGSFTVAQSSGNTATAGTLSVSGSAEISGAVQLNSTLDVNGQATLASANVQDLTNNGIVIAGVNGELEDDVNFTFDGTTFTVGQATIDQSSGNIDTAGTLTVGGTTTLEGNVFISGSLTLLESATSLIISSSVVELDDNIIRLNAFSPFQRYTGFEVIDSGSVGVSASLLWDSQNDYWLIQSSSQQTGKIISTTYGSFGSENSLTLNTIPKATGASSIGNSALTEDGTYLIYSTDALIVTGSTGNTTVKGLVTLLDNGGSDAGGDTSNIVFKNSSDQLGYVSSTDTTAVMDQILGYRNSDGVLVFSSVIDGGTF